MRRAATILALVTSVLLVNPSEVRAGAAAESPPPGKITGPAVSATIVIDPTFVSTTKAQTTIRLTKGTTNAGTLFTHTTANTWVHGCDGTNGRDPNTTNPGFNVNTLTSARFNNVLLRTWVPVADVLNPLFGPPLALGQTINDTTFDPIITDVDNPVCTPAGASRFILSFIATIQFLDHTRP